jgi:aerobic-type carbon monoxide dehydrogenase small subunit (CoxS/CutS family)
MKRDKIDITVNGLDYHLEVNPGKTLLQLLRDDLELFGAREGCGIGMCGSCTVLLDGKPISSCLLLAHQAEGHDIITVEGLAQDGDLHPVQQAYLEHAAFQCAYCTPGFILSTVALLEEHPHPDEATIRRYLSGNLCRCGSYKNVLRAVRSLG